MTLPFLDPPYLIFAGAHTELATGLQAGNGRYITPPPHLDHNPQQNQQPKTLGRVGDDHAPRCRPAYIATPLTGPTCKPAWGSPRGCTERCTRPKPLLRHLRLPPTKPILSMDLAQGKQTFDLNVRFSADYVRFSPKSGRIDTVIVESARDPFGTSSGLAAGSQASAPPTISPTTLSTTTGVSKY